MASQLGMGIVEDLSITHCSDLNKQNKQNR